MQSSLSKPNIAALRVALIYAAFSVLWILFSDQLLLLFVSDLQLMTRIQMIKGWAFVLMTSLIIYGLLIREISRVVQVERALSGKEHDYREVFNATNEGIVIHDAESGTIVDANRTFELMYGYSRDELRNISVEELSLGCAPFDQAEAEKRLLATRQGPQMFDWRCRRKNGELFWAEVTLKEANIGHKRRVIGVVRDIDDRKMAQERHVELEQRYQQAQKMEAIGTLAGGVAHDFNNILSAVLGYTELARIAVPEESLVASHLQEVTRAGLRAKDLVRQILTFSHRNQTALVVLKLQSIIREAMKLLRASIPTTIEIETRIDETCGPVLADPTQMHQVVMNLCTNGYYAMREKGGKLTVTLESIRFVKEGGDGDVHRLLEGKYLRLTVADTGIGMSPAIREKIFEPYFTTKLHGEGTGMGLSVVHGIVSGMGGAIDVHSVEGEGTTFAIYLPENETQPEEEVQEETHETKGTGTILLVDDEQILAELCKQLLEMSGYSVVAETDSRRALELFQQDPDRFDLIITDMSMPHLDGLSLLKKCHGIASHTPIVLYTGYSDLVNRESALAAGASEFLQKPVSRQVLTTCVERLLDRVG